MTDDTILKGRPLVKLGEANMKRFPDLWHNPEGKPGNLTNDDKEAIATITGVYAYLPGPEWQLHKIGVLWSQIQAYLLKMGLYEKYTEPLEYIIDRLNHARYLYAGEDPRLDIDEVLRLISECDGLLHAIIQREGLAANTARAFGGEVIQNLRVERPALPGEQALEEVGQDG